jgi:hypothetical protein
MRRRDLLKLAVTTVAVWPISAHGQQQGALKHIGLLLGLAKSDRGYADTAARAAKRLIGKR